MTSLDQQQLAAIATFLRRSDHARSNLLQDLMCSAEDALALLERQAEVAAVIRAGGPLTAAHMVQLRTLIESHEALAESVRSGLCLVGSYSHMLRDFASIISETLRIAKRSFDLAETVREVEQVIKVRFDRVPCRLTIAYEPAVVVGDADRLFRVIYLLLENSHGFVSTYCEGVEGAVEVSLSRDEEAHRLLLVIEDNGPGFDPAILEHLGKPGVYGDTPVSGAGWSLFFAQAVVNAHDGTLACGARADGRQGARVVISLPIAAAPATGELQ